ncbi:hypothetical protein ACIBKY_46185 [Nonomuraea sp. NPDC050394]|uniref:hypothetical protein n=1 Tax=Nonomuraea sp. NPDC050394 TaxID=3364363 RepID=UPI0037B28184
MIGWRPVGPTPPTGLDPHPGMVWYVEGTRGRFTWARGYEGADADRVAAVDWVGTALAAAAMAGRDAAVVGDGALASLVRLAAASTRGGGEAVVETTGTGDGIASALAMAPDLGRVLLAARPAEPAVTLDTYHDLHRRGVRLTPVPWAGSPGVALPDGLVAWALDHLAQGSPAGTAPFAPWYRLSAAEPAPGSRDET